MDTARRNNTAIMETLDNMHLDCTQVHLKPTIKHIFDTIDSEHKKLMMQHLGDRRYSLKQNHGALETLKYDLLLLCEKWAANEKIVNSILEHNRKRYYQRQFFYKLRNMNKSSVFDKQHKNLADRIYKKNTQLKVINWLRKIILEKKVGFKSEQLVHSYENELQATEDAYLEFIEKLKAILSNKQQELDAKTKRLSQLKSKCEEYSS